MQIMLERCPGYWLFLSLHRSAGAADGSLKIWDRRKPNEATYSSSFHTRSLLRVEWANYRPGVFSSRDSMPLTIETSRMRGDRFSSAAAGLKRADTLLPMQSLHLVMFYKYTQHLCDIQLSHRGMQHCGLEIYVCGLTGVLASGGYDGIVCVWDLNNKRTSPEESSSTEPPQEIIFQHAGHRNQVKFSLALESLPKV